MENKESRDVKVLRSVLASYNKELGRITDKSLKLHMKYTLSVDGAQAIRDKMRALQSTIYTLTGEEMPSVIGDDALVQCMESELRKSMLTFPELKEAVQSHGFSARGVRHALQGIRFGKRGTKYYLRETEYSTQHQDP
jgi:hypothetical protein